MQYKIKNILCDMKLLRDGKKLVIKKGVECCVSSEEYQRLSQVYGFAVKGEKQVIVRITKPVEFKPENIVESRSKRKHKRS